MYKLFLALTALLFLAFGCIALGDDKPIEAIEENWKQYASRFAEFNQIGVTINTSGTSAGKTSSEVMKALIVRNPTGSYVCEVEQTGREVPKEVEQRYNARTASGFCGDYGYTIVDYNQKNDWKLEDVGKGPVGKGIVVGVDAGGIYLPGLELQLNTLSGAAKNTNLVARKYVDGLIELDYEFIADKIDIPLPGTQLQRSVETAGTKIKLFVDPTIDYLPVRAVTNARMRDRDLTAERKWEYLIVDGKPCGPKRVTKEIKGEGTSIVIDEVFDLQKVALDEGRFRLPYYGLPEYQKVAPRLTSLYFAIGIGCIGGVLIYLAFIRKR